jgi:hypothetical protein
MRKAVEWSRNVLAVFGLLAAGFWLGSGGQVRAAGSASDDVEFQLSGVNETSSLLIYQPGSKTVYVYRGATTGNSTVQCSFKYLLLDKPGGPIQRVNCPMGSAM